MVIYFYLFFIVFIRQIRIIKNSSSAIKEKIIGIIISLAIVIINLFLGVAIEYLAEFYFFLLIYLLFFFYSFEKYHVRTKYNISYAKKTSFVINNLKNYYIDLIF